MQEFVTPPPLERGDRIAVVAPASNSAAEFPHVYELGLERLRDPFGLEPVEYPTATRDADFLYDRPEERASDVMDAFADPEIRGVIAVIGGNDQIRMLSTSSPTSSGRTRRDSTATATTRTSRCTSGTSASSRSTARAS